MASFQGSSAKIGQTPPLHLLKSSTGLEENYYAALRRHSFRKRLLLRYTMASFQSSSAKIGQAPRGWAGRRARRLVAPAGLIKKWQSGHQGLPAEVGNSAACPRPLESLQAIAASTTRPHSLLFQWAFSVKARYIREYLLILQLCISMPTLYFFYIQIKIYNFVGIVAIRQTRKKCTKTNNLNQWQFQRDFLFMG